MPKPGLSCSSCQLQLVCLLLSNIHLMRSSKVRAMATWPVSLRNGSWFGHTFPALPDLYWSVSKMLPLTGISGYSCQCRWYGPCAPYPHWSIGRGQTHVGASCSARRKRDTSCSSSSSSMAEINPTPGMLCKISTRSRYLRFLIIPQ